MNISVHVWFCWSTALDISLLNPQSDGVLTGVFSDAFLLRFPNCTAYGGMKADVLYQIFNTDENSVYQFYSIYIIFCNVSYLTQ